MVWWPGEIHVATEQRIYTYSTRDTKVLTSLPAIYLHARSSHAAPPPPPPPPLRYFYYYYKVHVPTLACRPHAAALSRRWFIRTISFIEKPLSFFSSYFFLILPWFPFAWEAQYDIDKPGLRSEGGIWRNMTTCNFYVYLLVYLLAHMYIVR